MASVPPVAPEEQEDEYAGLRELLSRPVDEYAQLRELLGSVDTRPQMKPAQPDPGAIWSPLEQEKAAFAEAAELRPEEQPRSDAVWPTQWLTGQVRRAHRVANTPIPGANPEVPTGMTAMEGVMLTQVPGNILGRTAGGGMGALKRPGNRPAPRPRLPPGEAFYSQLQRVVESPRTQGKMPGGQWLKFLSDPKRRVKKEEMEWTGLSEYLRGRSGERVTREEILDHLKSNQIQIKDVMKVGEETKEEHRKWVLPGGKNYREVLLQMPRQQRTDAVKYEAKQMADGGSWFVLGRNPDGSTFVAENLGPRATRETAQWVAQKKAQEAPTRTVLEEGFRGGHWDEANVIAHLRLNDRVDSKGRKTLLVEEIQSDWAQKGRRDGFAPPPRKLGTLPEGWSSKEVPDSVVKGKTRVQILEPGGHVAFEHDTRAEAIAALERMGRFDRTDAHPPRAPFVEKTGDWTRLALKRVLKMAADEGYSQVGIVRGEEQAARYDLSKQVGEIAWYSPVGNVVGAKEISLRLNTGGVVDLALSPKGRVTGSTERRFEGKALDEVVGKEIAGKILSGEKGSLRGPDLKVGGEGMKGFYDKILPEVLNKLGKEYGIKVQIEGGKVEATRWKVDGEGSQWIVRTPQGDPYETATEGVKVFQTEGQARDYLRKNLGQTKGTPIHTIDMPEATRKRIKEEGFPIAQGRTLGALMGRRA